MTEHADRTARGAGDDAFDLAIGRVVRAASAVERVVADIHDALTESPHARALTDGLALDHLLQGITRLADSAAREFDHKRPTITAEQQSDIKAFVATVRALMTERHSVVHGDWHLDLTDHSARMTGLMRRSGYIETTWTIDRLRDLHNSLRSVHRAGYSIMWHLLTGYPLEEERRRVTGPASDTGADGDVTATSQGL